MLYVTTRNSNDTYTARHTLSNEFPSKGGCFVPFRLPVFDSNAIAELKEKSYNQTISEILNAFFGLGLDKSDFPFDAERNFIRAVSMSHQIVIAELWHNLSSDFSYIEDIVYKKLSKAVTAKIAKDWPKFVVRIAIVFCLYGQLLRKGVLEPGDVVDFSVPNDSLINLMVLFYSRKMGLPVNTIICTCEDDGMWDLINKGSIGTDGIRAAFKNGIERLLFATLGCDTVIKFCEACDRKREFSVDEESVTFLKNGVFCSVVGKGRAQSVINSLYRTNGYIAERNTALCYGGLQDYRAKTGESVLTIIFAEKTPLKSVEDVSAATGLSIETIKEQLKLEV